MADTRLRRAKRELMTGEQNAQHAREVESSRSTGLRGAYKAKADAADRALAILREPAPRK